MKSTDLETLLRLRVNQDNLRYRISATIAYTPSSGVAYMLFVSFFCLCFVFCVLLCFVFCVFKFNDALNTFYLRLYDVSHMVKDHSDNMVYRF